MTKFEAAISLLTADIRSAGLNSGNLKLRAEVACDLVDIAFQNTDTRTATFHDPRGCGCSQDINIHGEVVAWCKCSQHMETSK